MLKDKRINLNMTQKELANSCGLNQSTISHFEAGNKKPSLQTAFKIANVLKVPVDELFKNNC